MKTGMTIPRALAIACGLVCIATAAQAQMTGSAADIEAINKIWINYAAFAKQADWKSWLDQWDAEGIQLRPDAPARTKQELDAAVPTAFKARIDANSMEMIVSPREIIVAGQWAYSSGSYFQELTSKATGKLTRLDGKFLTIFKKQPDGTWKIYRDCFNSDGPAN